MLPRDSEVRRPENPCETCPRRAQESFGAKLLRITGIRKPAFDNTCTGPEPFITSGDYDAYRMPAIKYHESLDCPKMYRVDSTDWNIRFLNGLFKEF